MMGTRGQLIQIAERYLGRGRELLAYSRGLAMISLLGLLPMGCKFLKTESKLQSVGESRSESYILSPTGLSNLEPGSVFQLRLSDNSEQCLVPYLDELMMMQCDGKAHWQLDSFDPKDRGITRISYRVSPLCLVSNDGRLSLAPSSSESCRSEMADLRLGESIFKDRIGKILSYLNQSPSIDIWIPSQSDEGSGWDSTIDSWNAELNYGPLFNLRAKKNGHGIYTTDGWTHSNRRWMEMLMVYSNKEGTAIAGIGIFYTDGENQEMHHIGPCDDLSLDCQVVGALWTLSSPPDVRDPEALTDEALLSLNYLEKVTLLHNDDVIVGIKLHQNVVGVETVLLEGIDPSTLKETPLVPNVNRIDQIVLGFYGAYHLDIKGADKTYLKDLGIMAGSFQTYARSWAEEWTDSGESIEFIREKGRTIDAYGFTSAPSNTDDGYFESVTATDPSKRHWISSIELFSGGGKNNFTPVGGKSFLSRTNDLTGLKVQHTYTDIMDNKQSQVMTVGWNDTSRPTKQKLVILGKYDYLSNIRFKAIKEDYEVQTESNWQWWIGSKGVSSLAFTIKSIIDDSEREIIWDPSIGDSEASTVGMTYSTDGDWQHLDTKLQDRAVIGFYGTSFRINNPQNRGDTETMSEAITKFGAIYTPIGCAFRYKNFSPDELVKIKDYGLVQFEQVDGQELASCKQ